MACNNTRDLFSSLSTSSYTSVSWHVFTPLTALTPGKYVRGVTFRVDTPGPAAQVGIRYFIMKLTTSGDPSTYTVYFASATLLINPGDSGLITLTFPTPSLVPVDGGVYYGAIQQGSVTGATQLKWLWLQTGRGGTDTNSSILSAFVTPGTTISCDTAFSYPSYFIGFSEEVCDTSQVVLTAASPIVRPTIPAPPDYQRWVELDADDILASTSINTSPVTANTPLTASDLLCGHAIDAVDSTRTVICTPDPIEVSTNIDEYSFTRTVVCSAYSLLVAAEFDPSQTTNNKTAQLTAADLVVRTAIGIPTIFSWALVPLTGESTRTPDSGIELVYEGTGLPREYTWYTKPRFNFSLKTAPLASNAYSAIMSYCNLNRYEEFEFVWVHDSSSYLCTFASEPVVTKLRSSTALGDRFVVSIELTGREV